MALTRKIRTITVEIIIIKLIIVFKNMLLTFKKSLPNFRKFDFQALKTPKLATLPNSDQTAKNGLRIRNQRPKISGNQSKTK